MLSSQPRVELSPYAAAWRDDQGELVASVYGGTTCEAPVDPRNLAAKSADGNFESALPCRKCGGCRRFQRMRLQSRLVAQEWGEEERLWLIEVECEQSQGSKLAARLSRVLTPNSYRGFFRNGPAGIVAIAAGRRPSVRALRTLVGPMLWLSAVRNSSRRRSWSRSTRGILVARKVYGAQVKRWYVRGLKPLVRDSMALERKGGIRKRHPEAQAGARAWKDGLTLYAAQKTQVVEFISRVRSRRLQGGRIIIVNQPRPAGRVSASSMTGFRIAAGAAASGTKVDSPSANGPRCAPAATASLQTRLNEVKAGRDASSQPVLPGWAADFIARMTAKAKARAPG